MKQRWSCYITFDHGGVVGMTKGKPNLRGGQYAIMLKFVVPAKLFARLLPEATIDIPEPALIQPEVEVVAETSETEKPRLV